MDISTHALTWSATILDLMWMSDREISTHALTWSATRCCARDTRDKSISTHALTWSATYTSIDGAKNSGYFNSRTHVECDKQNRFRHQKQRISTHALTWSATKMTLREKVAEVISTHALTWSATQLDVSRLAEQQFQLTHSRGVRHRYDQSYCTTQNFNSRTHVECDTCCMKSNSSSAKFQLTHSRGVRPCRIWILYLLRRFQLTHSRGVRRGQSCLCLLLCPFQLTHSRGVRHPQIFKKDGSLNFNSRTHVECDKTLAGSADTPLDFNSRTHVECDSLSAQFGV